jgi:RecG-like helicase
MGLIGRIRRSFRRMAESDEERLREEIQAWATKVPGAVPISEAPTRTPVTLAGVVRRITVHPEHGLEALEALLTDGTAEMSVLWMGRRSIPGLTLGTRVVVQGVVGEQKQGRRMVNPRFEFSG